MERNWWIALLETKPLLIIGIGNPSRGDDAIGPLLIEWLEQATNFDCRWNYQLQIEDAEEIAGYDSVLLIDAHVNQDRLLEINEVLPIEDSSFSTHSLSPATVTALNRKYFSHHPKVQLLSLKGVSFELGSSPSLQADLAMNEAKVFLTQFLCEYDKA
ncbi:MAG: Ni/Fe hydrogenase [Bdellovibrio sp. CG12_big_fil_rev_8_21_14_0_65_39_13]|nr:MAG: Ni/Fe hydrogenase [Bdellovibrio sp. CG22_combo_CG10-13_8_21_14_all_39_27]PIQ63000.1 MAG: Ni/Fe hydrogenase [Bdellovibrio sp. CG12_big_fil_rev_8_21_14_0_65_39_13]PIR32675.1 MAG: Ni/Fe hydrogenase [Bdellovibrio sp. CG11_big_fil_rev_8_21_14_0_20_39_38]